MLKALVKKQLRELCASFTFGAKGRRSRGLLALFALAMAYALGAMGYLMYLVADALCLPLVQQGLGWLYFALIGTMATALGVMGSVFIAHAALYQARDNELLLAMPVPPACILLVRLASIGLVSFLCEAVVLAPACGVYLSRVRPGVGAAVFEALLLFLLPLVAVAISCLLGWLIGWVLARIRKSAQNLVQVAFTLAFLAAYCVASTRVYGYLQTILLNSAALGGRVRRLLYPMYCMGRAAEGNAAFMALFTAMVALVAGGVYALLSRSFLELTTRKPGAARVEYKEKAARPRTPRQALLHKEWSRFLGTPAYLLNCGLGSLLLLAGAALALLRGPQLHAVAALLPPEWQQAVPLAACAAVAMASSTNMVTAPSVSLESRCLWLLQSLPVDPWLVLRVKLELHLQAAVLPAAGCMLALAYALRLGWGVTALALACVTLQAALCAALGLCANLRLPNLDWASEMAVVKQSPSVLVAMFGSWAAVAALAGLYCLAGRGLAAEAYLLVCAALLGAAVCGCMVWLRRRGTRIFAEL